MQCSSGAVGREERRGAAGLGWLGAARHPVSGRQAGCMPSSGLLCLETDWGRGLADAAVWLAKAYQLPGWVPAVGENMPPQGLLVGMCIVVRVGLLHERVAQCTGSHCPPPWVSVAGAAWLCSSISAIAAYRLDKLVQSAWGHCQRRCGMVF